MSKGTSGFCQLPCLRLAWERCRPGPGLGSPADVSRSPSSSSRTKWPDTCDVSAALAGHFVRDQALQHLSLSDATSSRPRLSLRAPKGRSNLLNRRDCFVAPLLAMTDYLSPSRLLL